MAKVDNEIAQGYLDPAKRPYGELENAWHHSIQSMACKTAQLPSHTPMVLIYEKQADLNEERCCVRNGVFMLSLENLHTFNGFLLFACLGLNVQFTKHARRYGVKLKESA